MHDMWMVLIGAIWCGVVTLVVHEIDHRRPRTASVVGVVLGLITIAIAISVAHADCPPEGDGGDPALNTLKNRTDRPTSTLPLSVDHVLSLPAVRTKLDRARWTAAQRKTIGDLEGAGVSVVGYFLGAKEEGPESANCHGEERAQRDFHLYLANQPTDAKSASMVVEITPRQHDKRWTLPELNALVRTKTLVRVSGWLMYDQEHGAEVGKSRGTLWEIHPITALEVQRDGGWYLVGAP